MKRFCAYCYRPHQEGSRLLWCGKCKTRLYCSRECQRMDWTTKGGVGAGCHKLYCQVGGEIDADYEIRETGSKTIGVGIYALRDFAKNDMIIVERPLLKLHDLRLHWSEVPESASAFVEALMPADGSFQEKWDRNVISCTDEGSVGESGLFLTLARINHNCWANSDHQFMEHRGVKLLVASRPIRKGEEITISYVGAYKSRAERQQRFQEYPYHFECTCSVCTGASPGELEENLQRAQALDEAIFQLGSLGKVDLAMPKGKALLSLYDQLGLSSWLYQRTYYDLFQVAITKKAYRKEAIRYIRLAAEALLAFTKDEKHPEWVRYQSLAQHPESHRNYRLLG